MNENIKFGDNFLNNAEVDHVSKEYQKNKKIPILTADMIKDYQNWYNKKYSKDDIKLLQKTLGLKNADGIVGKGTLEAIFNYEINLGNQKIDGLLTEQIIKTLINKEKEKLTISKDSQKQRSDIQKENGDKKLNSYRIILKNTKESLDSIIKDRDENTDLLMKQIDIVHSIFSDDTASKNYERSFKNTQKTAKDHVQRIQKDIDSGIFNPEQKLEAQEIINNLNKLANSDMKSFSIITGTINYYKNLDDYGKLGIEGAKGMAKGTVESVTAFLTSIFDLTALVFKYITKGSEYRDEINKQVGEIWELVKSVDKKMVENAIIKAVDHINSLPSEQQAHEIGRFGGLVIGFLIPMGAFSKGSKALKVAKARALAPSAKLADKVIEKALSIGLFTLNGPVESLIGAGLSKSLRGTINIIKGSSAANVKITEIDNTIKLLENEISKTKNTAKKAELDKALKSLKGEKTKILSQKAANDEIVLAAANDEVFEVKKVANGYNDSIPVKSSGIEFKEDTKNENFIMLKESPSSNVKNKKSNVASEEVLLQNAKLSDSDRIAAAANSLGLKRLTKEQRIALLKAHKIPQGENVRKGKILMSKGKDGNPIFTREQAQKLMDEGIAGKYENKQNLLKKIEKSDLENFEEKILKLKIEELEKKFPNVKNGESELRYFITPKHKIDIGGKRFLLTDKRIFNDGYEVVFGFIDDGGEIKNIFFYKSKSGGNWRASPGIEKISDNGGYNNLIWSKGQFAGLDYEKGTIPLDEIRKNLDNLEYKEYNNDSVGTINNIFGELDNNKKYLFKEEVEIKDGYFEETKNVRKYNTLEDLNNAYKEINLNHLDKNFKLVSELKSKHKFLGKITTRKYKTTIEINGKKETIFIEFSNADIRPDLPWVENIIHGEAKVNNYGIFDKQIRLGALASKPLDYATQLGFYDEIDKLNLPSHGAYRDLRYVIQENPLIKIYKNINGIEIKNGIPELYKSGKEIGISERNFQAIKSINKENIDLIKNILNERGASYFLYANLTPNDFNKNIYYIKKFGNIENGNINFLDEFADKIGIPKDIEPELSNVNLYQKNTIQKNNPYELIKENSFNIPKEDFKIISRLTEEQKRTILYDIFIKYSKSKKFSKEDLKIFKSKTHPDKVFNFEKNFNDINELLKKYELEEDLLKDFRKNNNRNQKSKPKEDLSKNPDTENPKSQKEETVKTKNSDTNNPKSQNKINSSKNNIPESPKEIKLTENMKSSKGLKDWFKQNKGDLFKKGMFAIVAIGAINVIVRAENNNIVITDEQGGNLSEANLDQLIATTPAEQIFIRNEIPNSEYLNVILKNYVNDIKKPTISEISSILENSDLRKISGHIYIYAIQSALSILGYSEDLGKIDGWMGPKTKSAIIRFQSENKENLQIPEDDYGILGPITTSAIIQKLKEIS